MEVLVFNSIIVSKKTAIIFSSKLFNVSVVIAKQGTVNSKPQGYSMLFPLQVAAYAVAAKTML